MLKVDNIISFWRVVFPNTLYQSHALNLTMSNRILKRRTNGILCSRTPKKGVEPQLRGGCSRATYRPQGRLYSILCSRGGLLGVSLTLAN